jgi:hypothetical protein
MLCLYHFHNVRLSALYLECDSRPSSAALAQRISEDVLSFLWTEKWHLLRFLKWTNEMDDYKKLSSPKR